MSTAVARSGEGRRFSDQRLRRIGWTLSTLGIVFAPITLILHVWAGAADQLVENFALHDAVNALCYGTLGLILIRSEPRNRVVWLFVVVAGCTSITGMISGVAELVARDQGLAYEQIDLSGWPSGSTRLIGQFHALWPIANFGLPTLGLLLAPDGRLLSHRWRPVAVVSALAIFGSWLLFGARWPLLSNEAIESYDDWRLVAAGLGFVVIVLMIVASYVSLVLRFRRSDAASRRRLRWLLVGGTLFVAAFFVSIFGPVLIDGVDDDRPFLLVFYPILALGFGLGIWRDQLFDVDVVISRTLVYVSTLVLIAGIYVAVVFGVGSLLDQSGDGSPVLPVVATGLVAIVFHPARVRLERLANRIVFGRRATPYEVLSDFTRRVAATDEQLLANIARSVADGTVATAASVWVLRDGMLEPVSLWPDVRAPAATPALLGTDGELIIPGADETYPIRHDNQVIGALGLDLPSAESLPPGDRALIDELTAGIGLALWNRELTSELRASVDALQASRRRLVTVQDETRHRLERDLHDGAQQRLVAIKVRLSIARQMADKAGANQTARALSTLCDNADDAIESLRDFARGVYPPLLEAEGLRAALEAQVGRSSLPIALSCDVDGRHGREIEATVYFTILEALAASGRHGGVDEVTVSVAEDGGRLVFEVAGPVGVEPPRHVEDRIDAVGGDVRFGDGPAVLSGWLPIAPVRKAAPV